MGGDLIEANKNQSIFDYYFLEHDHLFFKTVVYVYKAFYDLK